MWAPCLSECWSPIAILDLFTRYSKKDEPCWPHGVRCGSVGARVLGLWFRISLGAWIPLSCKCSVLLGRGLCDGQRDPTECSGSECNCETSTVRRPGFY
jgi:hypothetical protein